MLKYVHLIITAGEGGDTSRRLALSRFSSPPRRGGTHTAPGDTGVQPNALLPQTLSSLSTNFTWLQQIKTSPAAILMSPRRCHRRQVGFIGIRGEGSCCLCRVPARCSTGTGPAVVWFRVGFFCSKAPNPRIHSQASSSPDPAAAQPHFLLLAGEAGHKLPSDLCFGFWSPTGARGWGFCPAGAGVLCLQAGRGEQNPRIAASPPRGAAGNRGGQLVGPARTS